jgi:hypothetical protein
VFPVWSPESGKVQWFPGATVGTARQYAGRQGAVLFLPEKKTHKGAERAVRGGGGGGGLEASLYTIL